MGDVIGLGLLVASLVLVIVGVRYRRRSTALALEWARVASLRADGLQIAIDKAWDAAHEFDGDPGLALVVVCEWLEPVVTSEGGDG